MRRIETLALAAALSLGSLAVGCSRPGDAQARRKGVAPPPAQGLAQIATVEVAGDKPVLVVPGKPDVHRPIVHLHGMCDRPRGDLEVWGGVVSKEHGTVISLAGDVPCADRPGTAKWSDDAEKIDARISSAITAVNAGRRTTLDTREIVLVGESMGAARAESLAKAYPDRYARLVLIGSPQTASPTNLRGARAVASLAGEREPQQKAKEATRALTGAGLNAQFWELTGASHGEYGPDGERVMSEAIAFVAKP